MEMLDSLRTLFKGKSNNSQEEYKEDEYRKSMVAETIVDLVNKIKRINSFDSAIWNLNNVTVYELQRKSLTELENMKSTLEKRISELDKQSKMKNPQMEKLEGNKWTGEKDGMTYQEFDRWQRD